MLVVSAGTARGSEFSWVPVDADGSFTLSGANDVGEPTEIIVSVGGISTVEFEVRLNGWSQAPGGPTLGTAQATVDASGFLGVNAVPANPGVNLTPLNNEAYKTKPCCNGRNDGAFIVLRTCQAFDQQSEVFIDSGIPCQSNPATIDWADCPTESSICFPKPNYVFTDNLSVAAVATSTANYTWAGVTNAGQCTFDEGGSYYLGSLVLKVPAAATGTYGFGFDPSIAQTFMNDCAGSALQGPTSKTPGRVTLRTAVGKCCSNTRVDPQCIDSVTEAECAGELWPRFFTLDATCSGAADECELDCDGVAVSAGGQRPLDITGDGVVDGSDFALFHAPFCRISGPDIPMASPSTCGVFDVDCDGDLDLYDYAGFAHAFGAP